LKNDPKQSLRFCTADRDSEESRINKSLELQMVKLEDLRREKEEEGRRLDPRGWEGGTSRLDGPDGEKSDDLVTVRCTWQESSS
jgi:hypothetical protein